MIGPTCPKCRRIHVAADVIALSRFRCPPGRRYRVRFDMAGRFYATREEAQAALCAERSGGVA